MLLNPYVFRARYLLVITGNPKPEVQVEPQGLPASKFQLSKVGFPIRKSTGHRLFAPHRSLSQRTTSFIASYRQGIHQMPLGHLIALISNAHHCLHPSPKRQKQNSARWPLLRKTRSLRDKPRQRLRSARHQLYQRCMPIAQQTPQGLSPLHDVKISPATWVAGTCSLLHG